MRILICCRNSSTNGKAWSQVGTKGGGTPAAGVYNMAAHHLRVDRHILVNPKVPASSKVQYAPRETDHSWFYTLKVDFWLWISYPRRCFPSSDQEGISRGIFPPIYLCFRIFQPLKGFHLHHQSHELPVKFETPQRNGISAIYKSHMTRRSALCKWISQWGRSLRQCGAQKAKISEKPIQLSNFYKDVICRAGDQGLEKMSFKV